MSYSNTSTSAPTTRTTTGLKPGDRVVSKQNIWIGDHADREVVKAGSVAGTVEYVFEGYGGDPVATVAFPDKHGCDYVSDLLVSSLEKRRGAC